MHAHANSCDFHGSNICYHSCCVDGSSFCSDGKQQVLQIHLYWFSVPLTFLTSIWNDAIKGVKPIYSTENYPEDCSTLDSRFATRVFGQDRGLLNYMRWNMKMFKIMC